MIGGGGQLLLVCGVIILCMMRGRFICRSVILKSKKGGRKRQLRVRRKKEKTKMEEQSEKAPMFSIKYTPVMYLTMVTSLVTSSL